MTRISLTTERDKVLQAVKLVEQEYRQDTIEDALQFFLYLVGKLEEFIDRFTDDVEKDELERFSQRIDLMFMGNDAAGFDAEQLEEQISDANLLKAVKLWLYILYQEKNFHLANFLVEMVGRIPGFLPSDMSLESFAVKTESHN